MNVKKLFHISQQIVLVAYKLVKANKAAEGVDEIDFNEYENTSFTFLGYTFGVRYVRNKYGKSFNAFLPAVSTEASKFFRLYKF